MHPPRYMEDIGMWLLPAPAGQSLEVLVAGDRHAPDAARLAVVEAALAMLDTLRARATAYLDEFVNREQFAGGREWFLEGLESGRRPDQSKDDLSLYFSNEGDAYGEWSVTVRAGESRHAIVGFARRQI